LQYHSTYAETTQKWSGTGQPIFASQTKHGKRISAENRFWRIWFILQVPLKHIPQSAARKLSAVSYQLSAFERHEIVAACKEYGGVVIQCAARKLSAVSDQLLGGMKSSRRVQKNIEGNTSKVE
jgi:hypothetical protein